MEITWSGVERRSPWIGLTRYEQFFVKWTEDGRCGPGVSAPLTIRQRKGHDVCPRLEVKRDTPLFHPERGGRLVINVLLTRIAFRTAREVRHQGSNTLELMKE
ncbi:hypothetical protein Bbelb_109270 [Branchiostoma belcheri]|nr:hypothetical protein Bbelb_109270 [Branchiostoma belcheri]